jgi:hypothetical protein
MRVRFFDIKWVTDGEAVDLPTEITANVSDLPPGEEESFISENGAEFLSTEYPWLVESFNWEKLPPN